MKLTTGSIANMTPAQDGVWSVVFQLDTGSDIELCPVIGWATVVTAHLSDGTVRTDVQPAFVWGAMVWTETELREHTPTLKAFDVRRLDGLNDTVPFGKPSNARPKAKREGRLVTVDGTRGQH